MKAKNLLLSLLVLFSLASCEDLFDDSGPDGSVPHITIKSPVADKAIARSKGLRVNITVSDKDLVKNFEVTVNREDAETAVVRFVKRPNKIVLEIDTTILVPNLDPGNYTITATARDGRTNQAIKEANFILE